MIDIHAHILPGADDGARDMESAVIMAEMAAESGAAAIVATPHSNLRDFGNYWDETLQGRFDALQRELTEAGIDLKVYPGMEIFGTPEVPELLRAGKLITLAGSRYPLIEFPFHHYGHEATEILSAVAAQGYRPVVAHPERYRYVQEDPTLVNRWTDMGCLLQVNKGSLLGRFGRTAEMLSLSLVDRGFAAFVASDAHSPVVRTTWLADVREFLSDEFSEDLAQRLLSDHPAKLIGDTEVPMEEPIWF